jgi:ATP-dependent DNA helicase PIF1
VELKTVYRQKNDMGWYDVLQNVRRGTLTEENISLLRSRTYDASAEAAYPADSMTTLFPVNRKVDFMNDFELDRLKSKIYEFPSILVHQGVDVSEEQVKMWRSRLAIPEDPLRLAVGAQVMLTYNLNLQDGLVNGSQGIITGFTTSPPIVPLVRFINRSLKAPPLEVHPIEISNAEEESNDCARVVFRYFPLRLAWALSIHKVQGCNLDTADMDLGSQIFEYGQIYVALSRIRTLGGVFLRNLDVEKIQANPLVQEYYKQLEGNENKKKKKKNDKKKLKMEKLKSIDWESYHYKNENHSL